MLTLERDPIDVELFALTWTIFSAPATGYTYNTRLNAYNTDNGGTYSRTLTDLIYACLYDVPLQRPTAWELKQRTHSVLENAGLIAVSDVQRVREAQFTVTQQLANQQVAA